MGCTPAQASASVTIVAGKREAPLDVDTTGIAVDAQECRVTATIADGEGYRAGTAAEARATLTPRPEVTITADSDSVTEGAPVSFTLTATPAPMADLEVTVSWLDPGSRLAADAPTTVTIPISGTAPLEANTADDDVERPDGSVTVTVEPGSGYTVGSPDSASATVTVTDDNPTVTGPSRPACTAGPTVTIKAEGKTTWREDDYNAELCFILIATPAPAQRLEGVSYRWDDPDRATGSPTPIFPMSIDPDGESDSKCAGVVPDDNKDDATVKAIVEAGSGYCVGSPSSVTFVVLDDD